MSGFNTRAIHVGSEPDPVTGAVNVPVFFTSTYAQDGVGRPRFSDYSRVDNPTRAALEECLAGLEGARHGVAFASGLAGEDALLRTLSPGDHVILGNDAYGGTFRLMTRSFTRLGARDQRRGPVRHRRGARGLSPRPRGCCGSRPPATRCSTWSRSRP